MPLIYQRSYEAGLTILSYNGKYILTENAADKYVQYESFLTKMKIKETDDFLHNLRLPADKCLIVGEPEDLVPLEEKTASGTGPSPQCLSFGTVLPGSRTQRDRQSRFAGTPIGTCTDKKEDVIAIGDGYNDLSMIKFAGLGIAMANAQPPVKSNADRITAFTNDEDGVAHFIHDLLNSNTHQNIHEIG